MPVVWPPLGRGPAAKQAGASTRWWLKAIASRNGQNRTLRTYERCQRPTFGGHHFEVPSRNGNNCTLRLCRCPPAAVTARVPAVPETVMRPGPTTPEWWRLAFRSWKRPANGKPPPRAGSLFMKRVPVPLRHGAGPGPMRKNRMRAWPRVVAGLERETVGEASHLPAVLASPTAGRRALCRQRPCGPWRGAPPRSKTTPGQRPPSRVPRSQLIPGDAAQILCATSQNQDGCRAGPSGPPRSPAGSNPPEESNPQVKPPARNIRGGLTWGLPNRPGGSDPAGPGLAVASLRQTPSFFETEGPNKRRSKTPPSNQAGGQANEPKTFPTWSRVLL